MAVVFLAAYVSVDYRRTAHGKDGGDGAARGVARIGRNPAYRDLSAAELRAEIVAREDFLAQCKDAIEHPKVSQPACYANSPITVHVSEDARRSIAEVKVDISSLRAELALWR